MSNDLLLKMCMSHFTFMTSKRLPEITLRFDAAPDTPFTAGMNAHLNILTLTAAFNNEDAKVKARIILHEITHLFHPEHDDDFYDLLSQTGVIITDECKS